MIVPINNGRTITPIYIPNSKTNSQQTIQQTTQQTNDSEPTDWSNPGVWILILGAVAAIVGVVVLLAKLLRELTEGEE